MKKEGGLLDFIFSDPYRTADWNEFFTTMIKSTIPSAINSVVDFIDDIKRKKEDEAYKALKESTEELKKLVLLLKYFNENFPSKNEIKKHILSPDGTIPDEFIISSLASSLLPLKPCTLTQIEVTSSVKLAADDESIEVRKGKFDIEEILSLLQEGLKKGKKEDLVKVIQEYSSELESYLLSAQSKLSSSVLDVVFEEGLEDLVLSRLEKLGRWGNEKVIGVVKALNSLFCAIASGGLSINRGCLSTLCGFLGVESEVRALEEAILSVARERKGKRKKRETEGEETEGEEKQASLKDYRDSLRKVIDDATLKVHLNNIYKRTYDRLLFLAKVLYSLYPSYTSGRDKSPSCGNGNLVGAMKLITSHFETYYGKGLVEGAKNVSDTPEGIASGAAYIVTHYLLDTVLAKIAGSDSQEIYSEAYGIKEVLVGGMDEELDEIKVTARELIKEIKVTIDLFLRETGKKNVQVVSSSKRIVRGKIEKVGEEEKVEIWDSREEELDKQVIEAIKRIIESSREKSIPPNLKDLAITVLRRGLGKGEDNILYLFYRVAAYLSALYEVNRLLLGYGEYTNEIKDQILKLGRLFGNLKLRVIAFLNYIHIVIFSGEKDEETSETERIKREILERIDLSAVESIKNEVKGEVNEYFKNWHISVEDFKEISTEIASDIVKELKSRVVEELSNIQGSFLQQVCTIICSGLSMADAGISNEKIFEQIKNSDVYRNLSEKILGIVGNVLDEMKQEYRDEGKDFDNLADNIYKIIKDNRDGSLDEIILEVLFIFYNSGKCQCDSQTSPKAEAQPSQTQLQQQASSRLSQRAEKRSSSKFIGTLVEFILDKFINSLEVDELEKFGSPKKKLKKSPEKKEVQPDPSNVSTPHAEDIKKKIPIIEEIKAFLSSIKDGRNKLETLSKGISDLLGKTNSALQELSKTSGKSSDSPKERNTPEGQDASTEKAKPEQEKKAPAKPTQTEKSPSTDIPQAKPKEDEVELANIVDKEAFNKVCELFFSIVKSLEEYRNTSSNLASNLDKAISDLGKQGILSKEQEASLKEVSESLRALGTSASNFLNNLGKLVKPIAYFRSYFGGSKVSTDSRYLQELARSFLGKQSLQSSISFVFLFRELLKAFEQTVKGKDAEDVFISLPDAISKQLSTFYSDVTTESKGEAGAEKERQKPSTQVNLAEASKLGEAASNLVKEANEEEIKEILEEGYDSFKSRVTKELSDRIKSGGVGFINGLKTVCAVTHLVDLASGSNLSSKIIETLNKYWKDLGYPIEVSFKTSISYDDISVDPSSPEKTLIDSLKEKTEKGKIKVDSILKDLEEDPKNIHRVVQEILKEISVVETGEGTSLPEGLSSLLSKVLEATSISVNISDDFLKSIYDSIPEKIEIKKRVSEVLLADKEGRYPDDIFDSKERVQVIRELFSVYEGVLNRKVSLLISREMTKDVFLEKNSLVDTLKKFNALERQKRRPKRESMLWQSLKEQEVRRLQDISKYTNYDKVDLKETFVRISTKKLQSFFSELEKNGYSVPQEQRDTVTKLLTYTSELGKVIEDMAIGSVADYVSGDALVDNIAKGVVESLKEFSQDDTIAKSVVDSIEKEVEPKTLLSQIDEFNKVVLGKIDEIFPKVVESFAEQTKSMLDNLKLPLDILRDKGLSENISTRVKELLKKFESLPLAEDYIRGIKLLSEKVEKGEINYGDLYENLRYVLYDVVAVNSFILRDLLKSLVEGSGKYEGKAEETLKEIVSTTLLEDFSEEDKKKALDTFISSVKELGEFPAFLFELSSGGEKMRFNSAFVKLGRGYVDEDEFRDYLSRFLGGILSFVNLLKATESLSSQDELVEIKSALREFVEEFYNMFEMLFTSYESKDGDNLKKFEEHREKALKVLDKIYDLVSILPEGKQAKKKLKKRIEEYRNKINDLVPVLVINQGYLYPVRFSRDLLRVMLGTIESIFRDLEGERLKEFTEILNYAKNLGKVLTAYSTYVSNMVNVGIAHDMVLVSALKSKFGEKTKTSSLRIPIAKRAAVEGGITLEDLANVLFEMVEKDGSLVHYYLLQKVLQGLAIRDFIANGGPFKLYEKLKELKSNKTYLKLATLHFILNQL